MGIRPGKLRESCPESSGAEWVDYGTGRWQIQEGRKARLYNFGK